MRRAAVISLYLSFGFSIGTWSSAIPGIKEGFQLSESSLGLSLLASGSAILLVSRPTARLIELYGCIKLLVGVSISMAIVQSLFPLMAYLRLPAIWVFLLEGCTLAPTVVIFTVLATELEQEMRQDIMSQFHAGFAGGALLASSFYSLLYLITDWRTIYPLFANITLAIRLAAAYSLAARQPQKSEDPRAEEKHTRFRETMNDLGYVNRSLSDALEPMDLPLISTHSCENIRSVSDVVIHHMSCSSLSTSLSGSEEVLESCDKLQTYVLIIVASLCQFADACIGDWSGLLYIYFCGRHMSAAPLIYASFSAAILLGRIYGASLKRMFSRNVVLILGTALSGICMTVMNVSPLCIESSNIKFGVMIGTSFLAGLGVANTYAIAQTLIGTSVSLSTVQGAALLCQFGTVADMSAPGLMGLFCEAFNIQAAFFLPISATLLAAGLSCIVLRPKRTHAMTLKKEDEYNALA